MVRRYGMISHKIQYIYPGVTRIDTTNHTGHLHYPCCSIHPLLLSSFPSSLYCCTPTNSQFSAKLSGGGRDKLNFLPHLLSGPLWDAHLSSYIPYNHIPKPERAKELDVNIVHWAIAKISCSRAARVYRCKTSIDSINRFPSESPTEIRKMVVWLLAKDRFTCPTNVPELSRKFHSCVIMVLTLNLEVEVAICSH